jgi:hypothetical protein
MLLGKLTRCFRRLAAAFARSHSNCTASLYAAMASLPNALRLSRGAA